MQVDWLIQACANELTEIAVGADDFLFRLGDTPRDLYLVVEGEARACRYGSDGAEIVMQRSRAGELFAEAGLKRAGERVLHYLNCELTGPAGADLELDIPLAEWADDLGLEPETLYRALADLEKKGLIQREPRSRRIRIVGASASCHA